MTTSSPKPIETSIATRLLLGRLVYLLKRISTKALSTLALNLCAAALAPATAIAASSVTSALATAPVQIDANAHVIDVPLSTAVEAGHAGELVGALVGPAGTAPVDLEWVRPTLLRATSATALLPGARYTLVVQRTSAAKGAEASPPLAVMALQTRSVAPTMGVDRGTEPDDGGERFHPTWANHQGRWTLNHAVPSSREARALALEQRALLDRLPAAARERLLARMQETSEYMPLEATRALNIGPQLKQAGAVARNAGQAVLAGQVLRINGQPLAHATIAAGSRSTETDTDGEFLLEGLDIGTQLLTVDGTRAGTGYDYGRYQHHVSLIAGANELPHTIWLSRIDHAHAVKLQAPAAKTTVVTHPDIPGLELRIPAGAVVRDAQGQLVHEVSITPLPSDRTPFPMPYADVPLYYTLQPGGARIESADGKTLGAEIVYPNYSTQPPGAKVELFGHDPQGRGWYTYATGTISADGQRVETAEPFRIHQFGMNSAASSGGPPPRKGPHCDCDGDPVMTSNGLFIEQRTDLSVADVVPIDLERTYQRKAPNQQAFGLGSNGLYDQYLYFVGLNYHSAQAIQLVSADGIAVDFVPRTANDFTEPSNTFVASEPGKYQNAVLAITSAGWGHDFAVTTKDGSRSGFSYYHSRLKWIEDRWGNRTTIQRDTSNLATRVVSPNGRWIEFQYNAAGCSSCITRATDHSGRFVEYTYDSGGRLQSVKYPEGVEIDYGWDAGLTYIVTVKDARGNFKVTNEYYSNTGNAELDGRVKKQTYADGSTKTFTYEFDANNNATATEVADNRGTVHRREYDAAGYLIKHVYAKGTAKQQTWQYTRDPTTHLVTLQTDSLTPARQTRFSYDSVGNEKSRIVLYGTEQATTWQTSYEPLYNQPQVITDPLQRRLTRVYDDQGVLQEAHDDLGHKTTYRWNPDGQISDITQWPDLTNVSRQLTTHFGYVDGDLHSITDPLGRTTTFHVDALGRVVQVQDPAGQISSFTYDGLDRLTQRCNPKAECANYVYDGNNNVTQFVLGATQRDFTYDTMNRLWTEGRNSGQNPAIETTTTYDPTLGTRTTVEASGRTIVTNYDVLWRPATIQVSGSAGSRTLTYAWDNADRLQSLADSTAGTLSYTYDDRFDAVKTESGPTGTMTYSYYGNGLLNTATPTGGTTVTYGFDNANRLTSLSQAAGSGSAQPATTQNIAITYDDAGRRSTLTLANGIVLTYGWDDASQLKTMTWVKGGSALGDLTYSYDSLGRRTDISGGFARLNMPPTVTLALGADGRVATENGTSLAYDSNGRLIQDVGYKYVWDEMGRLKEMRNPGTNALVASFLYDPKGRRMQKTVNGTTTKYLHDGMNPVQIQDGAGGVLENLLAGGTDEWFARTRSGLTQHFIADAIGSTIRLTDAAGAKVVDYTYDPYGGTSNDNVSSTNVLQYAGRENDGLSLYFNRARYLKPKWGRFISPDPIGLKGGDNWYAYVGGNPLSYTDPTGEIIPIVIAAGVSAMDVGATIAIVGGIAAIIDRLFSPPPYEAEEDESEYCEAAEHTKNQRPSNWNKHTKPRPGRDSEKKRNQPGWLPNPNKKK